MCCKAVIGLVLGLAGVAAAQEPGGFAGERMVTVTAGVGNAMGWFGAQGERYFLDERISIFAGVGYTPRLDRGEADGPTFAAGFRSFITFDPKTRRGVVLLSSSSVSLIDALAKRMYDLLDNINVPTPKFADAALIAKYAGKYDFQGKQVAITAKGTRLYVEAPDEPKFRMLPISDHEFWIDPLRLVITFEQKDGKASRAIFVLGANPISAPRVAD